MDRKRCTFTLNASGRKNYRHPLHLCVDKVKWNSCFRRMFDSPCIASLSWKHIYDHSVQEELFVVVHLDHFPKSSITQQNAGDTVEACEEPIELLATNEFHSHYGINLFEDSMAIVPRQAFPLSRVVLSAKTEDTFKWANTPSFERGLIVAGSGRKKLLLRQGDWFLGQCDRLYDEDRAQILKHFRNLTALETYPVKQGHVCVKTEIIITLNEDEQSAANDGAIEKQELRINIFEEQFESFHTAVNFDPACEALCCHTLAKNLRLKNGQLIRIAVPTYEKFRTLMDAEDSSGEECKDQESSIINMLPASESRKVDVVCRLRVTESKANMYANTSHLSLHPSTLFLSTTLLYNAGSDSKFTGLTDDVVVQTSVLEEEIVPFAAELHLTLVRSPTYSPSSHFDQTLWKYLESTKIMKKGDILAVNTADFVEFLCETSLKDAGCKTIYYKVMGFAKTDEGNGYFQVDMKHTALYQDGTVNSYLPRVYKLYGAALGLSNYVEELRGYVDHYIVEGNDVSSVGTILLSGPPGCGKKSVVAETARLLGLHVVRVSCHELLSDSSGSTEVKIVEAFKRATIYSPCILVLDGINCIGMETESDQPDYRVCNAMQEALDGLQTEKFPVIVVAVTSALASVVSKIRSQFVHKIEMGSLTEKERLETLQGLAKLIECGVDLNTQWIAKHSVGFTYGEFWALLRIANSSAIARIKDCCAEGNTLSWKDELDVCAAGIACHQCDFENALKQMQLKRADIIGVPKIPDVKWSDIGGLDEVKATIQDTIQLPLEHPELVAAGLRRSGILLYGPPGTGKTLLAKAVATQCSLSFLSVKGPELINMYVGQSEENVRKIFARARDAAPCVVFFDELDSLAPNRGKSGDSGGVMDRVVSQLLAELDGLVEGNAEKQIFVIGASNRPDLIDPALLRPGRFDKLLYVGINVRKRDQLKILEAQTKRTNLGNDVCLDDVVEKCPPNMTGADFYALTSAATMNAIRRRIQDIETSENKTDLLKDKREPLAVEQIDFLDAVKEISPSVSDVEISRYLKIRDSIVTK